MTRAVENHQYISKIVNNVAESPPEPPPPSNEPMQRQNKFPSIELKEKRRANTNSEAELTRAEADMIGASGHDKDPRT